eukprot:TRINITY_DN7166_c0_g1_i1.p1 TRINITY_DN7166_c0_g1~~TRINITY_DN7166_c0_g1_i1.p1  ORF type:complete len:387 (+),score=93.29 TRINITY_DN7166_c0_g1_i1:386-1546(+)
MQDGDTSHTHHSVRLFYEGLLTQILLYYRFSNDQPLSSVPAATSAASSSRSTSPVPSSPLMAPSTPTPVGELYPRPLPPFPSAPQDAFAQSVKDYLALSLITSTSSSSSTTSSAPVVLPPSHAVWIKTLSLSFLRRVALFVHACLKSAPPQLPPSPASSLAFHEQCSQDFDALIAYLGLPTIDEVYTSFLNGAHPLIAKWLAQFAAVLPVPYPPETFPSALPRLPISVLPRLSPPLPFRLISLPTIYQTLYQQYSNQPCGQCLGAPSQPGLCLMCGQLVCVGSICCQSADGKGEATSHAQRCGGGSGLFLVVKTSLVLMIRGVRHAYWGSPYLDEHGEEDSHLRRGRPLYLNASRYNQLNYLFVNHQMDYDTRILELSTLEEADWY